METHISHNNDNTIEQVISRLSIEESKCIKPQSKGETRGQRLTGLTHECGVFGCIASGDWPSQIDVAQVVCLGKCILILWKKFKSSYINNHIKRDMNEENDGNS